MKNLYFKTMLLCICLFASSNAFAYDAEIDGIYYNFPTDSTAEVTYQSYQFPPYVYISDYSGDVVIPASVTYNDKTYSVTSIGDYAFCGCSGLTSITIPNSVTVFDWSAFAGCI